MTAQDLIDYIIEHDRVTLAALQMAFPMEPYRFDALLSEVHASSKITVTGTTYRRKVKKERAPLWIETVTDYPDVTPDTAGDDFTMDQKAMWQVKDWSYNRVPKFHPKKR